MVLLFGLIDNAIAVSWMKSENTITTDYYNAIAKEYDSKMDIDSNNDVRHIVRDYFTNISDVVKVLDFGAGTGSDLEWQLAAGYELTFYEPSSEMALVANQKINLDNNRQIYPLIGDKATYENLVEKIEELDATFSNFAVFNSIKSLDDLFEMLSSVLKKQGHLVCVVYNNSNKVDRLKSYLFPKSKAEATYVSSTDSSQIMAVYMHTKKQLVDAAVSSGFQLYDEIDLVSSGHKLYHFIKK